MGFACPILASRLGRSAWEIVQAEEELEATEASAAEAEKVAELIKLAVAKVQANNGAGTSTTGLTEPETPGTEVASGQAGVGASITETVRTGLPESESDSDPITIDDPTASSDNQERTTKPSKTHQLKSQLREPATAEHTAITKGHVTDAIKILEAKIRLDHETQGPEQPQQRMLHEGSPSEASPPAELRCMPCGGGEEHSMTGCGRCRAPSANSSKRSMKAM